MGNTVVLMQKTNLATLCLRLCEDIEEHYAESKYQLKPMPKDEAFNKEIAIGEDIYRAMYVAICDLIDTFNEENNEILVSTYRDGITVIGLGDAYKSLDDLCSIENDKFLIQRSRLGIALAFLNQEHVKIEQVHQEKGNGIGFSFQTTNQC